MRILTIFIFMGAILSIIATTYMSLQYLALLHDANVIEALAPSDDFMLPKITTMLEEHNNSELILVELKSRWKLNALLHATMTKMNAASRARVLTEVVLWLVSSAIFVTLLVWHKLYLRNEKTKDTSNINQE